MPLRAPRLDDRAYADLVAEMLARIPGHTPEYTHPVPGDPGHTMIELFAWLADTLLYRVNLIPERQRLEFLRRVGIPLRGARAAKGVVALDLKDLEGGEAVLSAVRLRAGCAITGPQPFETTRAVTVLPILGRPFHKRRLDAAERAAVEPILSDLQALYELGTDKADPYVTTEAYPKGRARPTGLDLIGQTVDGRLWIALLATAADQVEDIRAALGGEDADSPPWLSVGVVPADVPFAQDDLPDASGTRRRIELAWDLSTGETGTHGAPAFTRLDIVNDGTDGLTRAGVIDLQLPPTSRIGRPPNAVEDDIDAGVGPRPPRLDEAGLEARVVAWLRMRPLDEVNSLRLAWVGVNAVPVDQRRSLLSVNLGVSTGGPDQRFPLPHGGVEIDTFELLVEEETGLTPWARVDHLELGGRDSRIYVLDEDEGAVRFGDGVRGRIPEAGRRIQVARMRAGGGPDGNLPPGSLVGITPRAIDGSSVSRPFAVQQAVPTVGGVAAESLEEAERRMPDVLRHRNRAVTTDDMIAVAASTPGVRLGRVEVLPGFKPHQRTEGVPGVVSVMVLPRIDGWMPPAPRPTRHTLDTVHSYVSERTVLGTELYVIGCEYVPISLSIAYELRPGYDREETSRAVQTAARTLLWPLPPGGPFEEATGWPRGRPVRDREIEVAVARIPGVDEVIGVTLFAMRAGVFEPVSAGADGAASIPLSTYQLPELQQVSVVVDGPPETSLEPDADAGSGGVGVPVVPELC